MFESDAYHTLIDQLEELGLIRYEGGVWVLDHRGRTFLVGVVLHDVSDAVG
jgi:hypothetical protein